MVRRSIFVLVAVSFIPTLANAQTEEPTHPEPRLQGAAPERALPRWNLGVGVGFTSWIGGWSSSAFTPPQPQVSILVERRLSERLFLGFQAVATSTSSHSNNEVSSRQFGLDGLLGLRGVLNPGAPVEVSCFGTVSVSYRSGEQHEVLSAWDPTTGAHGVPQVTQSHAYGVGAIAGFALERQLIDGLALRLSSSVLELSSGVGATTTTAAESSTSQNSHGLNLGLRVSPSLELRYSF